MAPAVYVAAGLAAVVGFLALTRGSAAGSTAPGSAGSGSPAGDRLPPDLQAKFDELMVKGEDPDAMDQVATALEAQGFKTDAIRLRLRASELRAAHPVPGPTPAAPPPAAPRPVSPAPAPAPASKPITPGLSVLGYIPDLAPVGSAAAGNYFPRSVTEDAKALRFLGLPAGNPGGGVSQASDMKQKAGAWNPTFQAALRSFQSSAFGKSKGLVADGWIGPSSRQALFEAVELKNKEQIAKNEAAGQSNVEFAGERDPFSRIVTAGKLPGARGATVGAARGPFHGRA